MAETRDVKLRVTGDTRDATSSLRSLKTSFTEINQAVELSKTVFNGFQRAIGATFEALDQAQKVENVRRSFQTLQSQSDLLADQSLAKLRRATLGLVDDLTLMQQANQAVQLGLDPTNLDVMAEAAVKLGAAVGRTGSEAFADLITGVGRASPLILDNLGITIKAAEAQERYAAKIGVAVKDLSELEKAEAFRVAALDKIIEKSAQLDDIQLTAAASATQLRSSFENLKNEVLEGISADQDFAAALQDVREEIEAIDPEDLIAGIKLLANAFASATTNVKVAGRALGNFAADVVDFFRGSDFRGVNDEIEKLNVQIRSIDDSWNSTAAFNQQNRAKLVAARDALIELTQVGGFFIEEFDRAANIAVTFGGSIRRVGNDINGAQGEAAKFAKKVKEEIDGLTDSLRDLEQEKAVDDLRKQLEGAAASGSSDEFKRVAEKLKEQIAKGVIDGLDDAKNSPKAAELAGKIGEEQIKVISGDVLEADIKAKTTAAEKAAKEAQREYEKAFDASVDFFEDILIGAVEGNISDVLENMLIRAAIKFGAEMLAQVTGAFSAQALFGGAGSLGSFGSLFGGAAGGTTAAGLPVAAGYGGGLAGAGALGLGGLGLIAGTGIAGLRFGEDVASGNNAGLLESIALAPVTGGLSFLGLGAGSFGSGKGEREQFHDSVKDFLISAGVLSEDYGLNLVGGSTNVANTSFQNLQKRAGPFSGLGGILTGATGNTGAENSGDVTNFFANALSTVEDMNLAILSTQSLLGQLGTSAEQEEAKLVQAFLAGRVEVTDFNAEMDALRLLQEDVVTSVSEGFMLVGKTIDESPGAALNVLGQTFELIKESGAQDIQALSSIVRAELGEEAVGTFERLAAAGIDQFTDFNKLSAAQVQLLFNEILSISDAFDEINESGKRAGEDTVAGLDPIRETLRGIEDDAKRARVAIELIPDPGKRQNTINQLNSGGGGNGGGPV